MGKRRENNFESQPENPSSGNWNTHKIQHPEAWDKTKKWQNTTACHWNWCRKLAFTLPHIFASCLKLRRSVRIGRLSCNCVWAGDELKEKWKDLGAFDLGDRDFGLKVKLYLNYKVRSEGNQDMKTKKGSYHILLLFPVWNKDKNIEVSGNLWNPLSS